MSTEITMTSGKSCENRGFIYQDQKLWGLETWDHGLRYRA